MKKVSISILLVLPIVLIFFISLLGRIITPIVRIPVESIAVTVLNEKVEKATTLTFDLDEYTPDYPLFMEVEVKPEFANDKTYTISNVDDNVAYIANNTKGEPQLFLHEVGSTTFEIKSKDNIKVTFTFSVKVVNTGLKEILVFDVNDKETETGENKFIDNLDIAVGKTAKIGLDFRPISTDPIYKDCTLTIEDETVASLKLTAATYTITGLKIGETDLIIFSNKLPSVYKIVHISVTATSNADAYFNFFTANAAFILPENNFSFVPTSSEIDVAGKIYINEPGLTYDELILECITNKDAIDLDKLVNEKTLSFKRKDVVTINMYRMKGEQRKYLDSITVYYNK